MKTLFRQTYSGQLFYDGQNFLQQSPSDNSRYRQPLFPPNRKRNGEMATSLFSDFLLGTVEESDKVENYGLFATCFIDFNENINFWSLSDTFSVEIIGWSKIKNWKKKRIFRIFALSVQIKFCLRHSNCLIMGSESL